MRRVRSSGRLHNSEPPAAAVPALVEVVLWWAHYARFGCQLRHLQFAVFKTLYNGVLQAGKPQPVKSHASSHM